MSKCPDCKRDKILYPYKKAGYTMHLCSDCIVDRKEAQKQAIRVTYGILKEKK